MPCLSFHSYSVESPISWPLFSFNQRFTSLIDSSTDRPHSVEGLDLHVDTEDLPTIRARKVERLFLLIRRQILPSRDILSRPNHALHQRFCGHMEPHVLHTRQVGLDDPLAVQWHRLPK